MSSSCQLDGWFSWVIQTVMGAVALSSLIIKWRREIPRRRTTVFIFDTTKQASGMLLQHFGNLFFSIIAGNLDETDQCSWYLGTLLIDSLVGTLTCWLLTKLHSWLLTFCRGKCRILSFGDYSNPPQCLPFIAQMGIWWLYILLSKCIVFPTILLIRVPITVSCSFILKPLQSYPELKILVVVFLIPFIVNTTIFWIQDSFLKKKDTGNRRRRRRKGNRDEDDGNAARLGLLEDEEDDPKESDGEWMDADNVFSLPENGGTFGDLKGHTDELIDLSDLRPRLIVAAPEIEKETENLKNLSSATISEQEDQTEASIRVNTSRGKGEEEHFQADLGDITAEETPNQDT